MRRSARRESLPARAGAHRQISQERWVRRRAERGASGAANLTASITRGSPELDAIKAYHPGGIAGFVEEGLSRLGSEGFDPEDGDWLVDIKRGVYPSDEDVDFSEGR